MNRQRAAKLVARAPGVTRWKSVSSVGVGGSSCDVVRSRRNIFGNQISHFALLTKTQRRFQSNFVRRPPVNKLLNIVPQGEVWVVERLGKYQRTLQAGLHMLFPVIHRIAYVHSTKEQLLEIPHQSAVTKDNVHVSLDGVIFLKIVDAHKASYNIDNPVFSMVNLAQTTLRSEIGKMTLDRLFEERDSLNTAVEAAIQRDANEWGVECKRYEIRDIRPSDAVRQAMDLQAEAERYKRKTILQSEAQKQSAILESEAVKEGLINRADGEKLSRTLVAEAERTQAVRRAEGDAEAIRLTAEATATAIERVATAIANNPKAIDAMSLNLAEKYLHSFQHLAKSTNTLILPGNLSDPAGMVAQAMSVYQQISNRGAIGGANVEGIPQTQQITGQTAKATNAVAAPKQDGGLR